MLPWEGIIATCGLPRLSKTPQERSSQGPLAHHVPSGGVRMDPSSKDRAVAPSYPLRLAPPGCEGGRAS